MRKRAEELAAKDGVSINHFINLAVAEKISRLEAVTPQPGKLIVLSVDPRQTKKPLNSAVTARLFGVCFISKTLNGSATPRFVIPSEAEEPAARLSPKQKPYK